MSICKYSFGQQLGYLNFQTLQSRCIYKEQPKVYLEYIQRGISHLFKFLILLLDMFYFKCCLLVYGK